MPTFRAKSFLMPLMIAWILFQRVGAFVLATRDQLTLRRPTVAHVRRPVSESGLIHLPPELLYHIVGKLEHASPETTSSQGPLLAFSQVCRGVRELCSKSLFKRAPPLAPLQLASRFEGLKTAANIGSYVHRLSISLVTLDPWDKTILSLFDYLLNLTDLTATYLKGDTNQYRDLVRACCRRTSLQKLRLMEANLDLTVTPTDPGDSFPGHYFVDYFVEAILAVAGIRLKTFAHIASLPLHSSTFMALRAHAHLRTVVLRTSIQSNLRALFNQPERWASASTLQKLVIRTCSGVHAATVAVHVASGVFGHLHTLSVIRCGYDDNGLFQAVNQPPTPTIDDLKRLDIDHADLQEVMALSTIHVQDVYATRVFTIALINALDAGGWPGLRTLHSQENCSGPLFLELRRACDAREINLSTDAVPYGKCTCHDE